MTVRQVVRAELARIPPALARSAGAHSHALWSILYLPQVWEEGEGGQRHLCHDAAACTLPSPPPWMPGCTDEGLAVHVHVCVTLCCVQVGYAVQVQGALLPGEHPCAHGLGHTRAPPCPEHGHAGAGHRASLACMQAHSARRPKRSPL